MCWDPGSRFNIQIFFPDRDFHYKDSKVWRSSYLYSLIQFNSESPYTKYKTKQQNMSKMSKTTSKQLF